MLGENGKILFNATCVLFACIGIVIIAYFADDMHLFPDKDSLIITFIGILATFVVVSNFSQVASIEQKTDKKIKIIDDAVSSIAKKCLDEKDETSLVSSLHKTQKDIDIIKGDEELRSLNETKDETKNEIRKELQSEFENYKRASIDEISIRSLQMLRFANAMINSKQNVLLQKLLTDITALFKVTYLKNGHTKTNNARIQIKEGELVFISDSGRTTYTNILKIDGVTYHPEEIDLAIIFILEASTKMAIYDKMSANAIQGGDDQL